MYEISTRGIYLLNDTLYLINGVYDNTGDRVKDEIPAQKWIDIFNPEANKTTFSPFEIITFKPYY